MGSLFVHKGDTVRVLRGKDRGKEGKVLTVLPKDERVVVEGINLVKRHTRPTRQNPTGGVVERPAPLHVSKVQVVCPSCNRATRVGRSRGERGPVRVCKRCGKALD